MYNTAAMIFLIKQHAQTAYKVVVVVIVENDRSNREVRFRKRERCSVN